MSQLELTEERQRAIDRYLSRHRGIYLGMARMVQPDPGDWEATWLRATFAILSANARYEDAAAALDYCARHKGQVDGSRLKTHRMTPNKAEYVNALPLGFAALALTRQPGESYHTQRVRLTGVRGLALAKASFLTALLDPLNADVACVDTHLQRVYLQRRGFRTLKLDEYLAIESQVRVVAERHHVSTFLAQWAIWDHARGQVTTHAIFPGSHK